MMLTISLQEQSEEKTIDIMVDNEQKISSTLKVLQESGLFQARDCQAVRSQRTRERVQIGSSYQEGNIYNGDTLVIE